MNKNFKAEIIADSLNPQGDRLTTFVITFPRIVLAEFNTHRMFSRNSASSRAIPFKKMVKMVEENPFIPIAWQKDHKGMQGTEYLTDLNDINGQVDSWLKARNEAVHYATELNQDGGVTKQLCNRLLEPFMWHTVIVTATEWENFFKLRCPRYKYDNNTYFKSKRNYKEHYIDEHNKSNDDRTLLDWLAINESQAEIHIQAIAELMWDEYNESKPKQLEAGDWHIPFGDKFDKGKLNKIMSSEYLTEDFNLEGISWTIEQYKTVMVKIATARCARVSYLNYEGKDDYEADVRLHNRLIKNKHASPMEHCAEAQKNSIMYANFKGFKQYRKTLEENKDL